MFFPPKLSYLPDVLTGIRESIQIAALGTAIAAVLALPFGVLSRTQLSPAGGAPVCGEAPAQRHPHLPRDIARYCLYQVRRDPGPFAGVLAIAIHSIGMIGKLYAERIETVDKGALEALAATGASPLEIFRNGIVPEVLPDFLSFALYRFDLNVRSASVLGLVGAGGIGTLLQIQRLGGNWPEIGMIVLGIVSTVLLVDFFSAKLRAKLA